MCDSRVFLIRIFWENERLTSTEHETATEDSFYPKSENETEISELKTGQPTETINDHLQNLEYKMIDYKIKRLQEKMARLTTENGSMENERMELENELLACKSRIDQLETGNRLLENQKKKYQTESLEKQAQLENERMELENELLACKFRIDQLESGNRLLKNQKKKFQTQSLEKQAQLEKYEKENNALIKCRVFN